MITFIQTNPVAAVVIAAAVGILFGTFLAKIQARRGK